MSEIRSQATPARDDAKNELATAVLELLNRAAQIGTPGRAITAHVVARGLTADGWSKPRTVNSAADLDALPDGSIILFGGMAWQACEFVSKTYPEGYICWVCHESWRGELGSADVIPATVLFTPGEAG